VRGAQDRVLGLIPAKSGSRRVAGKNLRALGGKSLLEWAIASALAAKCLDRVVVSTEDEATAGAARAAGAEVPFARPAHLAQDPYGVVDVCLHALEALEAQGDRYDHLAILLPSSPFRSARHIEEALEHYRRQGTGFLMSVSRMDYALLAAHVLRDGRMAPLLPEWRGKLGARANKAELPELVKSNGAVTVVDVARFRAEKQYYVYPLAAYEMHWPEGLDIDTEDDLLLAEELVRSGRAVLGA
jgi:CMP-N-acetylneuraminic acid synthetase